MSEWNRTVSKLFGIMGEMRAARGVVNHRGLELTRGIGSAASSSEANEHVAMVRDLLLWREEETLPATVTTTESDEESSVEGMMGE